MANVPNLYIHTTFHDSLEHSFQIPQQISSQPQIILILNGNHQVRHIARGPQLSLFAFRRIHPIISAIMHPTLGGGQLLLWLVEACVVVP
jgi:hypothetical protein